MNNPFDRFDGQAPDYVGFAREEAQRVGLDPELVARVMLKESSGNPSAVSPKGARGLMQLMPGTAKELGVDPDDPYDNIRGGVRYLKQQMDEFGGDERLALAAYNAGPGAVRQHGGVPPFAETQEYVATLTSGARNPFDQFDGGEGGAPQDDYERGQVIATSEDGSVTAELLPPEKPSIPTRPAIPVKSSAKPHVDQGLGFLKGVLKPLDNAAIALEAGLDRIGVDTDAIERLAGNIPLVSPKGAREVAAGRKEHLADLAARGIVPGRIGEFAGNVVGTLPLAKLPGGALVQGGAAGGLLSEADGAGGVVRDVAIGAVAGKVADEALKAVGKGLSAALGKKPSTMSLAELEAAKRAAYRAVDDTGFRFKKADAQALAGDLEALVQAKGGKTLYPDAWNWSQRLKELAGQKGGLPLSQLDDARGEIYTQLVKSGGKESTLGVAFRQKIDDLIASAADENALLRQARDLNARFAKANVVTKRLESADLATKRAYTGKNVDNTIRQKMSPLIDPLSPQRLRNATSDEIAALKRVVEGTGGQNAARTVGALLDPRGILGMGLQGTLGIKTAGAGNLIGVPVGYLSTVAANRASQKNVENLLRLIAAGGSKEALKTIPTKASQAAGAAVSAVRPAVPAAAVAAIPRKRQGVEATRERR